MEFDPVNELVLYSEYTYRLQQLLSSHYTVLDRHRGRGDFDDRRAYALMERYAKSAAKMYFEVYGDREHKWNDVFTVQIRQKVAEHFLNHYYYDRGVESPMEAYT